MAVTSKWRTSAVGPRTALRTREWLSAEWMTLRSGLESQQIQLQTRSDWGPQESHVSDKQTAGSTCGTKTICLLPESFRIHGMDWPKRIGGYGLFNCAVLESSDAHGQYYKVPKPCCRRSDKRLNLETLRECVMKSSSVSATDTCLITGSLSASLANTIESQRQRCTCCDGSLPSPLHLAIIRSGFLMMFPPAAAWTRAVGLRGQFSYLYLREGIDLNVYLEL